jgi:UDP-N-acetylglucosamine:LPS N-acetylglucosamine transferase
VTVADEDLSPSRFIGEADALLGDGDRRARMAAAAKGVARPDAAEAVAALLEAHVRG